MVLEQSSRRNTLTLSRIFDLRLWLIGALLPDIIDKPIGHYLFNSVFHGNGRIFAHTLLFLVLLLGLGLYLKLAHHQDWMLPLAGGTAIHLLLDGMWRDPHPLFWPLLGAGFPPGSGGDWLRGLFEGLLHNPAVYLPELLGLIILLWFLWYLLQHKHLITFLRTGQR
jgi:membrane-bound metal-dependent hydrolase YbcI (DUF457 family)